METTITAERDQAIARLTALGATVRKPSDPYPYIWWVIWPGDRMQHGFRTTRELIDYAAAQS
jgi:hypothetical protein